MGLAAEDAGQVLRIMARRLRRLDLVHATFEEALLAREAVWPTALPLSGRKLAIPHADPKHVIVSTIACATLAAPVRFREMGAPDREIAVEVVVLLALGDSHSAQRELVRLLEKCQDSAFMDRLCACTDATGLRSVLEREVGG